MFGFIMGMQSDRFDAAKVAEIEACYTEALMGSPDLDGAFIDLLSQLNRNMMPFCLSINYQGQERLLSQATLQIDYIVNPAAGAERTIVTSAPASVKGLAQIFVWLDSAQDEIANERGFDGIAAWTFVEKESPAPDFANL